MFTKLLYWNKISKTMMYMNIYEHWISPFLRLKLHKYISSSHVMSSQILSKIRRVELQRARICKMYFPNKMKTAEVAVTCFYTILIFENVTST